jgi:hypothetical protein
MATERIKPPTDYAFPSFANSNNRIVAIDFAVELPFCVVFSPPDACTVTMPFAMLKPAVI